jgi:hypothetical protein
MESSILNWRKSSHSGGNGGSCVEVGQAGRVLVRDTKQDGTGPVLRFSPAAWRRFADEVKRSLAGGGPRWSAQCLRARRHACPLRCRRVRWLCRCAPSGSNTLPPAAGSPCNLDFAGLLAGLPHMPM